MAENETPEIDPEIESEIDSEIGPKPARKRTPKSDAANVYICKKCGKALRTNQGLKLHITRVHGRRGLDEDVQVVSSPLVTSFDSDGEQILVSDACSPDPSLEPVITSPVPEDPTPVVSGSGVGSMVRLHGQVYWQSPATFDWELAVADMIIAEVVGREPSDNDVFLMLKVPGGQALWSVRESDVLSGLYKLVKLVDALPKVVEPGPEAEPDPEPVAMEPDSERDVEAYQKELAEFEVLVKTYDDLCLRYEILLRKLETEKCDMAAQMQDFVIKYGQSLSDDPGKVHKSFEIDGREVVYDSGREEGYEVYFVSYTEEN
jgi:hypothetical protein